jgi:hypothetical protein
MDKRGRGRPATVNANALLTQRVPKSLLQELHLAAASAGLGKGEATRLALKQFIENQKRQNPSIAA